MQQISRMNEKQLKMPYTMLYVSGTMQCLDCQEEVTLNYFPTFQLPLNGTKDRKYTSMYSLGKNIKRAAQYIV